MAISRFCTTRLCFFKLLLLASWSMFVHSLEEEKPDKHPDKSYQKCFFFVCLYFERVKRRGTHTHTQTHRHLRIEDSCYFCHSTHIDCTIYSSLYSKIQRELDFTPCSGMAFVSLKRMNAVKRNMQNIDVAALHSKTQFALLLITLCFTVKESKCTVQW